MIPFGHSNSLVPTPLSELDSEFVQAFGPPALLTLPCDSPEKKSYDFSGNRNNGTLNGGITVTGDGVGSLGQSWNLNGTNSYISIPASSVSSLTSAISVRCIARLTSLDLVNGRRLIANWDGSHGWILEQASDGNWKFWINNGTSTLNAAGAATAGAWVDLLGTFDGTNIRLYENASLKATTALSGSISTSAHAVYIGRGETMGIQWMLGQVAAAFVYPTALSQAQVSALYSSFLYGEPYRLFVPSVMERFYSFPVPPTPQPISLAVEPSVFLLIDEIFP